MLGEGAADIFPPLIEPTAVVGKVKQDIAELLGIPKSTIVAAGSGDNMMSALGVFSFFLYAYTLQLCMNTDIWAY